MSKETTFLYIFGFALTTDLPCSKVGVSINPWQRLEELVIKNNRTDFLLHSSFRIGNRRDALAIETMVINSFPVQYGREYLAMHPERVFRFCRKIVRDGGLPDSIIYRNRQFYELEPVQKKKKHW